MTIRGELDEAVQTFLAKVFEVLRRHPLSDLIDALGEDAPRTSASSSRERRPVGRPRKHAELVERVVGFVRAHPDSGRSEIARGVGANASDVRRALAKAKADGSLEIHGSRRTARYTAS